MAQNITIAGASYSAVPAVDIPKTGGGTAQFFDTTDANATASEIKIGKTAYVNGVKLTGTLGVQALIYVTAPSGSTLTCGGQTYTLGASETTHSFAVDTGTYTVTATKGSDTESKTVSVTEIKGYEVTISFKPTASTSAKSGVSYSTDLSGITAAKMKEYGEAISNNSAITNTTSDVYIDDDATHIKMSVGASKSMTIDGGSYEFIIIGFNHDTLTTPTYYGAATATGKAGITWQTRHCLNTKRQMNSSNTNVGGWTSCAMRTSTMNILYNGFGFKDAVAPVNKLTSAGNQSSTINTDSDKLFLLSEVEIFGNTTYAKAGEGTQYAWYKAGNTKVKNVSGSAYGWWERSPYGNDTTFFCAVISDGSANRNGASNAGGVAVGFCS